MNELGAQLLGFVGFLFLVCSFQSNSRSRILLYLVIGQLCFVTHFAFLNAWVASALNGLGVFRGIVYFYKNRYTWAQHHYWPYLFSILLFLCFLFTYDSWIGVLPLLGSIIETIALWQNRPGIIRLAMILSQLLWLVYNYHVITYAGVFTNVFVIISCFVGVLRFDLKNRKNIVD